MACVIEIVDLVDEATSSSDIPISVVLERQGELIEFYTGSTVNDYPSEIVIEEPGCYTLTIIQYPVFATITRYDDDGELVFTQSYADLQDDPNVKTGYFFSQQIPVFEAISGTTTSSSVLCGDIFTNSQAYEFFLFNDRTIGTNAVDADSEKIESPRQQTITSFCGCSAPVCDDALFVSIDCMDEINPNDYECQAILLETGTTYNFELEPAKYKFGGTDLVNNIQTVTFGNSFSATNFNTCVHHDALSLIDTLVLLDTEDIIIAVLDRGDSVKIVNDIYGWAVDPVTAPCEFDDCPEIDYSDFAPTGLTDNSPTVLGDCSSIIIEQGRFDVLAANDYSAFKVIGLNLDGTNEVFFRLSQNLNVSDNSVCVQHSFTLIDFENNGNVLSTRVARIVVLDYKDEYIIDMAPGDSHRLVYNANNDIWEIADDLLGCDFSC